MHRILVLDSDHPLRAELLESVLRTANTEVVIVANEEELIAKLRYGAFAAVFADAGLLTAGATRLLDAVRSAIVRPMVVIAADARASELDPDLITLIVRKPYDVKMLTGVLLSAVLEMPNVPLSQSDTSAVC